MYEQNNAMMNQNATPDQAFILPAMVESCDFTAEELAEDMDGLSMSFTRIKIPSGGGRFFEIPTDDPDNPESATTLEGVILYHHPHHAYWPESNDDEDNKPLCSSFDGKVGIGCPGGACTACQMNTYGTAAKGAGKACKNMRVIYLLRSGEYLPIQINLPPTSIRPFQDFYGKAFALRRRAPYGSIVRIGLKPETNGKEDYSVATFRRVADFSGEKLQQVRAYAQNFKDQLKVMTEQRAKAAEEQQEDLCEVGCGTELPMSTGDTFVITPTIDGEREVLPD